MRPITLSYPSRAIAHGSPPLITLIAAFATTAVSSTVASLVPARGGRTS